MGELLLAGKVPQLVVPSNDIALADIAEGSIVKLNENGSPVEFYVACHNYESALNGTGRTLLVRKDCYDQRQWHTSSVNTYASCTLDSWFNGDYKALHDAAVQSAMGTTKFYYTPGNGTTTVSTLSRSIFALSLTELGRTTPGVNEEGSTLPIASTLRVVYLNGSLVNQWTRSPSTSNTGLAACLTTSGIIEHYVNLSYACSRPAFTLPSTAKFDPDTLLFKGAS